MSLRKDPVSWLYPPIEPTRVHRLKVSGADGSLKFSRGALKAIFDYSGGIPRVVNIVCDNALLLGFVQETRKISEELVREVIRDLEGDRRRVQPQPQPQPQGS